MNTRLRTILALAPLLLALTVLFLWPLAAALVQSLGHAPIYGITNFPTFKHFGDALGSGYFWQSAGLTFYYAFVGTMLVGGCGVALALAARRRFRGAGWLSLLCRLPLMVPYLAGVALIIQLFSGGGVVARIMFMLGAIDEPADFPPLLYTHAGLGIFAVMLWKQAPFIAMAVQTVLMKSVPEYEEAAQILGAGRFMVFRRITLPLMMPALAGAGMICFAFNFGVFELPFILGGGHPDTLAVAAWRSFNEADYSKRLDGMALIVLMILMAGGLMLAFQAFYRGRRKNWGRI